MYTYIHMVRNSYIWVYIYRRIFMTQYTISYIFALYTYIWYPPKTYLSSKVGGTYSVPSHLSLSTSDPRFKFQDPKHKTSWIQGGRIQDWRFNARNSCNTYKHIAKLRIPKSKTTYNITNILKLDLEFVFLPMHLLSSKSFMFDT